MTHRNTHAAPSTESFHSSATTASDCSTPITPTFSVRGHNRFPSSTSSLGSSPPMHDPTDASSMSAKLPKLTEEPLERENSLMDDTGMLVDEEMCLCGETYCAHQAYSSANSPSISRSVLRGNHDSFFGEEDDFTAVHVSKRRRSEDSTSNAISTRLACRFPSLSQRWKDRKRVSGLSIATRSYTPSRDPSMERSSSQTKSTRPSGESHRAYPLTPNESFTALAEEPLPTSPVDIVHQEVEAVQDPIDREALASTPLLPPTLMKLRAPENTPVTSPLQSPTIAESSGHFSFAASTTGTPRMSNHAPTPPLSTKPSFSSLAAARSGPTSSNSEITHLNIDEEPDEWCHKLGHANFTIYPEPYVPDNCDAVTCRQLFHDWEHARQNFMKHQVRTGEHVGVTSTTYKLTEQKWAQIDARWRLYHDIAFSRAGVTDEQIAESSPIEPAPLVKLPSLNSKFPGKGDEDIVGPMEVAAPMQPRTPKSKLARFFSDIKVSFGRSAS
ncbi:hypothetical protein EJ05DRAFT_484693 [Pseudovirgaria hyperparasitica]|uniref:Only prolin and serin are matching in the corresponding protein n=1 Tax=Pseudovirgaria hyperparasitica TaxID=470096 RepID=A0A6A6WCK7_9PEZI|nr:uncharacterized protein EJ05DRAFT_484693 [Pseudovirgaria hyperparasitica]KAF2759784.1 hypothetical protein EJ05DRAFT_484693 [Pseudovirgaria hyperparasitica]